MLSLLFQRMRLGAVSFSVDRITWATLPGTYDWSERLIEAARDPSLPQSEVARCLGVPTRALATLRLGQLERTAFHVRLHQNTLGLLTPAERRVAYYLLAGSTAARAAKELGCSPRTVHAHTRAAYRTLGVQSVADLALVAVDYSAEKCPAPQSTTSNGPDRPERQGYHPNGLPTGRDARGDTLQLAPPRR